MTIIYSDKSIIARSEFGFVLNFSVSKIEGVSEDAVVAQIGMSPQFAKNFLIHLYSEIGKFEAQYGEIKMSEVSIKELKSNVKPPIGFK